MRWPDKGQTEAKSQNMLWTLAVALTLTSQALATSITDCHAHGSAYYCVNTDGVEGSVSPAPTGSNTPQSYTSCHNHGTETYCMSGADEVLFAAEAATSSNSNSAAESNAASAATSSGSITSVAAQTTAITDCHLHGLTQYCVDGSNNEGYISPLATNTADLPLSYTSCHAHETDTYCMSGSDEVQFVVDATDESELSTTSSSSSSGQNCHFHAGVEHCVGSSGEESESTCERTDRDYNIPVRIGTLFAILATSAIGVFLPMVCSGVMKASMDGTIITILTQFGTGVILSTALVHLTTHAELMFANDCITLYYESTATAIIMAGLFIGFLVDFGSTRLLLVRKNAIESGKDQNSDNSRENEISDEDDKAPHSHSHGEVAILQDGSLDKMSVLMLEAGIIFHSVLIGVTTVVAGDSYYITLFIVVIFHQAFEGVALGSRIAKLTRASVWTKVLMGSCYAITTPIGMGIGIGALQHWNGNDPSTIIAVGTLDAFSAGILLWVGLIEMLAHDWLHGPVSRAGFFKTALAMAALVAGMVLMSFLGKWT